MHYRSSRNLTQGTKAKLLKRYTIVKEESFQLRPRWKNCTFFSEKSELQSLGISILNPVLGISSVWESQNNIFQQIQICPENVFLTTEKLGKWKESNTIKTSKPFQLLSFVVKISTDLSFFIFFSRFHRNRKNFSIIQIVFCKEWYLAVTSQIGWIFREKSTFIKKTVNCVELGLFFAFMKKECVHEYLKRWKKNGRQCDSNPSHLYSQPLWHPTLVICQTPLTR